MATQGRRKATAKVMQAAALPPPQSGVDPALSAMPAGGGANSRDAGFRPVGETADAIALDLIGGGDQS